MLTHEHLPQKCLIEFNGEMYVRIGGDDWSPNLISVQAFDERFNDIADVINFLDALATHPVAQTPGWQQGIVWIKSQV